MIKRDNGLDAFFIDLLIKTTEVWRSRLISIRRSGNLIKKEALISPMGDDQDVTNLGKALKRFITWLRDLLGGG